MLVNNKKQMSVAANEQYSDSGVAYNSAADWAYPPAENLSLFGTVLLPKIYGSNLSELEVASDGMISLHVNNTKAFELDESSVPTGLNLSGNNFQIKSTDTQNLHITSSSTDESVVIGSQRIYKADNFQKSDTNASNGFKFEKSATVEGGLSVTGDTEIDGSVQLNSNLYVTGAELRIPLGTEAARPATTEDEGLLYYNKDLERFEGLFKTGATKTWNTLGGVIDNDQDTFIVAQSNNQDTDTLYFHTQNDATPLMTMGVDSLEFNKDLESSSASVNLNSTLSVTGEADVVAATRLGNTLSVSGAAALKSTAAVEGAVSMGSTLSVLGEADVVAATRLGDTLSVTGAADIVGVAQLGNSLSVGGQASFKDNVTVDSNLYLSSTTVLTEKLGHYSQYNNSGETVAKGDLDMFYENVTIHGNLDIYGNLNQIDTTTSSLYVEDKQIVLGVASTSAVTSNANGFEYQSSNFTIKEEQIHEGGLLLNGIPGKFHDLSDGTNAEEAVEINKLYEKSFLWNLPANNEAGTSNLALISKDDSLKHVEPFWEVKGGQFRLTQHTENSDAKFVSFAFRINTKEQLELVKIKDDGSSAVNFKTIAKFGSVIAN